MKTEIKLAFATFFFSMCILSIFAAPGSAEDYEALKGVKSIKALFDFRDGKPQSALIHVKLVHQTYKDKAITKIGDNPDFVVVFMASSVKLLSKNRDSFSSEEKKHLDEMDKVISAMSKDGIKLEICMFAANLFGVASESVSPEINRVHNGWISSMGYQAKGYSLIPAY